MIETEQSTGQVRERLIEGMRVLIVGGIPVGVLVAGVGSRLAMLLLRVTSPDQVVGVISDDGFIIGRVTLGGTYNLLMLGAVVGVIGAGAYRMVAPWLIGSTWIRRLTIGLASAAVIGSMLVHADGVDFTLLQPTWLAIGLFVALPALFGVVIGPAVDAVRRPDSWTAQGRRRWLLPIILVGSFPFTLFVLPFAFVVLGISEIARRARLVNWRESREYGLLVRSFWLLIAIAGLVALWKDIEAIV